MGFRILEGPGRGADRGRDLLVSESISGAVTLSERKWVVSAKHFAHSGRSVGDSDELDPIGRVRKFGATGFMAIYSTLPSSGLDDTFSRIRAEVGVHVWDRGRLELSLMGDQRLLPVLRTYFPRTFSRVFEHAGEPIPFVNELVPLTCANCGKNLLIENGIVVFVKDRLVNDQTIDLYGSCKGACDIKMREALRRETITTWIDLGDLRIPAVFVQFIMSLLNQLRDNPQYVSDRAFIKNKDLVIAIAQNVLRNASFDQKTRIGQLLQLPTWLGGLGSTEQL